MTTRSRRRSWLRLAVFAGLLGLLLAACRDNLPQSTLNPAGPEARQIDRLFIPVFWIAVGVFVVVEGLIVFAALRFRQRRGREQNPVQTHGNTVLEVVWTLIPALILAVIAVPTVGTIFSLSRIEDGTDPIEVRVVGHQWWWEFEYPELGVVTANELRIPTGRPIALTLTAEEAKAEGVSDRQAYPVIHSFWVPRLAGKQDVIPGRENFMRFTADEPGDYLGQCAEYCGLSHANMKFRVIAETPQDFDAWVEAQKRVPAADAPPEGMEEGWELFHRGTCIGCHTVDGTQGGLVGPNLARFGTHRTIGAGMFKNTPEVLARWLDNPRAMKPGAIMPDYGLTEDQIEALVEYLMSLK